MKVKNWNEALAGAFLVLVSLLALYFSRTLSSSTEVGLGPGYIPKMFAWLQMGFGLLMVVHATRESGEPMEAWHMRPLVLVLGSVGFFALTVERLGLVVSLVGLILIGSSGSKENRLVTSLILAISVAVFSVVVFVKALGLPMLVWPPFF